MKVNSLLLLLSFGFAVSAFAWDDSGHLLIAQIAYDRLASALQQKLSVELSGMAEGAASSGCGLAFHRSAFHQQREAAADGAECGLGHRALHRGL